MPCRLILSDLPSGAYDRQFLFFGACSVSRAWHFLGPGLAEILDYVADPYSTNKRRLAKTLRGGARMAHRRSSSSIAEKQSTNVTYVAYSIAPHTLN
jgi:hypothetical protein